MKKKRKLGPVKQASQKADAYVRLYANRDKYGDKISMHTECHGPMDLQIHAVCVYVNDFAQHLQLPVDAVLAEMYRRIQQINQQRVIAKVTKSPEKEGSGE